MAIARGVEGVILLGEESTYGTPVAPTKYIGLIQSTSGSVDQTVGEHYGLGQSKSADVSGGLTTVRRSIDFLPTNGRFLEYFAFGGTTTHVDSSTDCTHTMVWANDLPFYTLEESYEQGGSDLENTYTSYIAESLNITLNVDGELTASVSGNAQDLVTSTSATAYAAQSSAPFKGIWGSVNIGGSISNVQSWGLTINRNSSQVSGMGSRKAVQGNSHTASVEFTARIAYSASTFDTGITGNASGITATEASDVSVTLGADNGVSLGSGERSISIALTGCQYSSVARDSSLDDFVFTDITGKGQLSTTTFVDQVLQASW